MLYAKKYLDSGIPAKEQKELFEKNAEAGVQRLMNSEGIRMHVRDGSIVRLAKSAIDNTHPFRGYAESAAKEFGRLYEAKAQPLRLKKAQRDKTEEYAFDLAASELGIDRTGAAFSRENPLIIRKAKELKKDPGFRETMSRILDGKNEGQLTGKKENANDRVKAYALANASLKYEKRCARITAEAMLKKEQGRAPSAEELDRAEKELRKDVRFQAFCKEKLEGKNGYQIDDMRQDLTRKAFRDQTVQSVCGRFVEPPKLNLSGAQKQEPVKEAGPAMMPV